MHTLICLYVCVIVRYGYDCEVSHGHTMIPIVQSTQNLDLASGATSICFEIRAATQAHLLQCNPFRHDTYHCVDAAQMQLPHIVSLLSKNVSSR